MLETFGQLAAVIDRRPVETQGQSLQRSPENGISVWRQSDLVSAVTSTQNKDDHPAADTIRHRDMFERKLCQPPAPSPAI
jgi:hypothetical protein